MNLILATIIILPLLQSLCCLLIPNKSKIFNLIYISFSGLILVNSVCLMMFYNYKDKVRLSLFKIGPFFEIAFMPELFGIIFLLLVAVLWVITSIYSISYMDKTHMHQQNKFLFFMAISISMAINIAMSANLFTMFVFYELLTLSTYPLVNHYKTDHVAKNSKKYLLMLIVPSILFFLPAIIITYNLTSNIDFENSGVLKDYNYIGYLFILFFLGIAKTAVLPFSSWLPAAMVAPTPVSALLHAVAVVKAGIFCLIKISIYILDISNLKNFGDTHIWFKYFTILLPAITIIIYSLYALKEHSLKKILAFSTIVQLSYTIIALILFSQISVVAAIIQMITHALSKITLFFAVGKIYADKHLSTKQEIKGLYSIMPKTSIVITIAALSIIAIPPLAGFFGKYNILMSAIEESNFLVLAVIVLSTILNIIYFKPFIYDVYFSNSLIKTRVKEFDKMFISLLFNISLLFFFAFFYLTIKLYVNNIYLYL